MPVPQRALSDGAKLAAITAAPPRCIAASRDPVERDEAPETLSCQVEQRTPHARAPLGNTSASSRTVAAKSASAAQRRSTWRQAWMTVV